MVKIANPVEDYFNGHLTRILEVATRYSHLWTTPGTLPTGEFCFISSRNDSYPVGLGIRMVDPSNQLNLTFYTIEREGQKQDVTVFELSERFARKIPAKNVEKYRWGLNANFIDNLLVTVREYETKKAKIEDIVKSEAERLKMLLSQTEKIPE